MARLGPALTVAILAIFILTESDTAGHTPLLFDVSVKVTKPFRMSAVDNVYCAARLVTFVMNPPLPLVDQLPVAGLVRTLPFKLRVF